MTREELKELANSLIAAMKQTRDEIEQLAALWAELPDLDDSLEMEDIEKAILTLADKMPNDGSPIYNIIQTIAKHIRNRPTQ